TKSKFFFLDGQPRTVPHSLATCNMALGTVLPSVQRRLASAKRLLSENGEPLNGEPVPVALNLFQHLEFSRFF
ncbi:MAG TPA: hypothetical protein DIT26_00110, partial [Mesotoga infera]|nr:hypothetical protein [Mesotoga infera]